MPPPGQQGHGSYVWVPNTLNAEDDAVDEEQLDAENMFDDMAVEDNNGSAHISKTRPICTVWTVWTELDSGP